MPRFTGVQSVVRTVRRVFFDLFGGKTRDEIKPLNIDVVADRVDPTIDETIPVEVSGLDPDEHAATLFGPINGFDVDEGEDTVAIASGFEDRLTEPADVMDFDNPHMHGKLMHFRTADVPFPDGSAEQGELRLGLGVFPDGPSEAVSLDRWDVDRVAIPPRGDDN